MLITTRPPPTVPTDMAEFQGETGVMLWILKMLRDHLSRNFTMLDVLADGITVQHIQKPVSDTEKLSV